jgi:site-specific DNA recombinase
MTRAASTPGSPATRRARPSGWNGSGRTAWTGPPGKAGTWWNVLVENDVGASSYSRKPRPLYAQLLERAQRREFDVILAYSNSRLTRRPLELEDLIRLHESTGVRLATVVSGDDDLSTADGRMVARIKASVDAGEAERVSERTRRGKLQRARQGRPMTGGGRPFGYANDRLTVIEAEAEAERGQAGAGR